MSLQIHSQWQTTQQFTQPSTDAERHEAFSSFAVDTAQRELPWLLPLLSEAGARIYVAPSMFCFQLPSQPGRWIEVPEVARLLAMVPWVAQDETQQ